VDKINQEIKNYSQTAYFRNDLNNNSNKRFKEKSQKVDNLLFRRVLGEVLREMRKERGWTLKVLSTMAGVSLSFMSELERGAKEASSEVLLSVCKAFGIQIECLLDKISDRYKLLRQLDDTLLDDKLLLLSDTIPSLVA
jgi:transcriptional regulator with XRE-family HTH domain